jgi:hypothetical protein
MNYIIVYFHSRIKTEIEAWPCGVLADFAKILELLMEFGPTMRMPHSRAMGDGLFELRPRGREGIGRVLLFHRWPANPDTACLREKDAGYTRKRIAHRPEKNEGG